MIGSIVCTSTNLQTNPTCAHSRCYNKQATKINQVGLAIATSSSLRAFSPRHSRALRTKLQKLKMASHCRFLGDLSILRKRLQPTNTSPQSEAQRQDRHGVHLLRIGEPRLKTLLRQVVSLSPALAFAARNCVFDHACLFGLPRLIRSDLNALKVSFDLIARKWIETSPCGICSKCAILCQTEA